MEKTIQLDNIQKIFDDVFLPLSKNIVNIAYSSVSNVNSILRVNLVHTILSRYEGKNVDPCYIDIFRMIKVLWVKKVCQLVNCSEVYKHYVKVIPNMLSIYLINKYTTLSNLIHKLRWYLYGILLSDGSLVARRNSNIIRIHTTDPSLLGVSLMFSSRCMIMSTMIRKFKREKDRFRIYFLADMYGLSEILNMYYHNEEPSSDEEYAQFLAGLIDGDGNIEPEYGKVRISIRINPKSTSTEEKNRKTLKILLNGAIIDENSLTSSTLLKYDYISIRLKNERTIKILNRCLKYLLIPHKREGLAILLRKRMTDNDIIHRVQELVERYNLTIRCRRKRVMKYIYKIAYIRSRDKALLEMVKNELACKFQVNTRGPYKVDDNRYEIVFPERISRYICGD